MGFDKGHMEFTTLDLKEGFHNVPGYPPGFSERIIAGSLDEQRKVGNRTRILRIEPGASLPYRLCMTTGKKFF
jgi:hypothetical protein